jgi:Tfp pilus assembly protein PilV
MMRRKIAIPHDDSRGFTLAEVMIASMVLMIGLLAVVGMFPVGYAQVADAGRMTYAVTGARQILEDVGALPFANLDSFNPAKAGGKVFDSTNSTTLPANGTPELAIARRWRYMLAGEGDGSFAFTDTERAQWGTVTPFAGRATVQVTAIAGSTTLNQATVTVSVPGLLPQVTLTTVIARMF